MDQRTADQIMKQLNDAGSDWRDQLPGGAIIAHDSEPTWCDTIQIDGEQFHRVEITERLTGWTWSIGRVHLI